MPNSTLKTLVSAFSAFLPAPLKAATIVVMDIRERGEKRRAEAARDILLEELGEGAIMPEEADKQDETVSIIHRYYSASINGAARINLRLMAKIINNMFESQLLSAQNFLYYADVLSSLRQDEIVLIATLHRIGLKPENKLPQGTPDPQKVWEEAQKVLIPNPFENLEVLRAVASGTMRTGLLTAHIAWSDLQYTSSILFHKLLNITDFDDALQKEGMR